jgi:hypothetical protein
LRELSVSKPRFPTLGFTSRTTAAPEGSIGEDPRRSKRAYRAI